MPAIAAFISFGVFVAYAVAFRITSGQTSSRELMKVHLKFGLVYVALAIALQMHFQPDAKPGDWLVGGFIYWGLHYVLFMYLHAVPRKSVSVNLCMTVMQANGVSKESLYASYGQGKGMQYIILDRMASMEHMGFVKRHGETLSMTKLGLWVAKIHLVILRIWGMRSNSGAEND